MEIDKQQLFNFITNIFENYNRDKRYLEVSYLSDLIANCYENKIMFDSWFNNMDVMN